MLGALIPLVHQLRWWRWQWFLILLRVLGLLWGRKQEQHELVHSNLALKPKNRLLLNALDVCAT